MTRFLLSTLILFLTVTTNLHAQTGSISGVVSDSTSAAAIPFASVILLDTGNVQTGGAVTNLEGEFNLSNIPLGTYRLLVTFIGYSNIELEGVVVSGVNPNLNVGVIPMFPVGVMLDKAVVTATASAFASGIDRRSYHVVDFETTRGGNALDVLNKLPSVSVSPDGELTVRGTGDFMVYINGRPTQMEPSMVLSQIAASSIERIDVITVPTARFDAQGKGGIININTKTSGTRGWSVSANMLGGGAPWNHGKDPYTDYALNDNRYGGGFNLIFSDKKWSLFSAVNYNFRNVNASRSGEARILNVDDQSYRHLVAAGMKPEWYENFTVNLGAEYRINSRSGISASWYHGNRTEWRKAFYLYQIFDADESKNQIPGIPLNEQWILNPNEGIRKGLFNTFNIDYQHKITKDATINLSALYEHSLLSQTVDNPNIAFDPLSGMTGELLLRYRQEDRTPLDGIRLSAEYAGKLKTGQSLNIGFQPQFFSIDGGFSYDTLHLPTNTWGSYSELENKVNLARGVYAGFADLAGIYQKLQYKVGLRVEYTDQLLKIDNPDYFTILERATSAENPEKHMDWFPSLHASYPLFNGDNIMLAASRRINRSPLKNMAPFLYRRHLEVYVVGDPELQPEYITTAELTYQKVLGRQRLTLTGFYRGVDNAVFRVNTVYEEEMVLIRSFTNSGNTTSIGGELNVNLEFGKRWRAFLGGSIYDYHVRADVFGFREDQRGLSWSLKGNTVVQIAGDLKVSADFDIRSAQVTAQGRNEMVALANAALTYNPANLKGWGVTLRGLNLLNSNISSLYTRAYNPDGVQIFYQDTEFIWYGPIAEMSITYNLNWKGQTRKGDAEFGRGEF
jgi:outer membrane receptor protein involved in Fe transport